MVLAISVMLEHFCVFAAPASRQRLTVAIPMCSYDWTPWGDLPAPTAAHMQQ